MLVGISGKGIVAIMPLLAISFGVFIFAHGMVRYGLKSILAIIGIGMAVSLFYEALSIATGFPYSSYHYTELLGTAWDIIMDPIGATVFKAYIWENHGPYFGIPLSNFLGWYLCTYTLFQLVALVLYRQKNLETPAIAKKKIYWYQVVVMYAAIYIQVLMLMIFGWNDQVSIASGQVFQTNDIYQAMTLVGITAILFPAFIGFVNVFNTKELE
jgi:putative membrane protein